MTPGSRGLDVGCGTGSHTRLLAETVQPGGIVTGIDLSMEAIDQARKAAAGSELENQVSFRIGDMTAIPFEDDFFDWIWSMDCVGYAPVDPLPVIKELVRVVKPGGIIAILAWSSQQLLPGYPGLEAKLNATTAGIAPFVNGKKPEAHFLRASGWFREAGLRNISAHTFVRSVHAPLADEVRAELQALLAMRWPEVDSELSPEDLAEYRRICDPNSDSYIINQPDYLAFFTYTMFQGQLPGN